MKKFFLLTRGRTGSSTIVDHLRNSQTVSATQELFASHRPRLKKAIRIGSVWGGYTPFNLWKQESWMRRALCLLGQEHLLAQKYLTLSEKQASEAPAIAFCFKILSNQLDERPYLLDLLKNREYSAIYLTRNAPRQVLSGMVARERGLFNTIKPDFHDEKQYFIDLKNFERLVRWELQSVEKDLLLLRKNGFDTHIVTYEEFCKDKNAFFARIFGNLGLPPERLDKTDYRVMITDVSHTIKNYDEVVDCVKSMGLKLEV